MFASVFSLSFNFSCSSPYLKIRNYFSFKQWLSFNVASQTFADNNVICIYISPVDGQKVGKLFWWLLTLEPSSAIRQNKNLKLWPTQLQSESKKQTPNEVDSLENDRRTKDLFEVFGGTPLFLRCHFGRKPLFSGTTLTNGQCLEKRNIFYVCVICDKERVFHDKIIKPRKQTSW